MSHFVHWLLRVCISKCVHDMQHLSLPLNTHTPTHTHTQPVCVSQHTQPLTHPTARSHTHTTHTHPHTQPLSLSLSLSHHTHACMHVRMCVCGRVPNTEMRAQLRGNDGGRGVVSSQHTSAYVSVHQHTSPWGRGTDLFGREGTPVLRRQHTSVYVSIRAHTGRGTDLFGSL
jgi:hypothetical protein